MSGIYLLVLIAVWIFLTWLLKKAGQRFLESSFANRPVRLGLVVIAAALWFGGSFWEAGGKKLYWDAKVRELCEKDGGVKVYETVELPEEMFNKWGNVGLKNKKYAEPTDQFYYEIDQTIIREEDPIITKYTTRVFRRVDSKILGVSIRYGRGGGDFPGPWHPSSYDCPKINEAEGKLETSIFQKGAEK